MVSVTEQTHCVILVEPEFASEDFPFDVVFSVLGFSSTRVARVVVLTFEMSLAIFVAIWSRAYQFTKRCVCYSRPLLNKFGEM